MEDKQEEIHDNQEEPNPNDSKNADNITQPQENLNETSKKSSPNNETSNNETNPEDLNIETKKENFRKYLEEKGMMNILTKLLVELYERNDRPVGPEQSFEYCSRFFSKINGIDINTVKLEIEQNKQKLSDLQGKLDALNEELNDPDQ